MNKWQSLESTHVKHNNRQFRELRCNRSFKHLRNQIWVLHRETSRMLVFQLPINSNINHIHTHTQTRTTYVSHSNIVRNFFEPLLLIATSIMYTKNIEHTSTYPTRQRKPIKVTTIAILLEESALSPLTRVSQWNLCDKCCDKTNTQKTT